jgi:ornithine cyclodeaminase/alanine dehydrogenase-like protein (mu-crystallin family)
MITSGDVAGKLTWTLVADAIEAGHRLKQAQISDQFLSRDHNVLLSRAAWVEGLGMGVKSVTVMPENGALGLPSIHGAMLVFSDQTGQLRAIIDADLVTAWKTAADSVLGARFLARSDSSRLLIVGAGVVAQNLVRAYSELFPGLNNILIWNRTRARAQSLVDKMVGEGFPVCLCQDLAAGAAGSDIVSCATMSRQPVLKGAWITPGTHIDLIGAFKADMREADDDLLQKSSLFADSCQTTIKHIGEFLIPIAQGTIKPEDIKGDLYDLAAGKWTRSSSQEITLFKNGGGAHLDLMTAQAILKLLGKV